ncbi:drebrin A [Solea senegalensis]|uniref:Drebrin A n=1 Tax=Solea senegalensis TaxID=28829 RepID=A0AAV6QFU2_SOLSE|nr:drebrin-like protein [Solea senegalensis]KAG7488969.1 drebrin A [Solea senegalensis]
MGTRKVNLDTYSLSLLTAKEDIINPRSSTNWALFAYDGVTDKLKLADSGAGGVAELVDKFHAAKPQYGLCKVGSGETGGLRIAMIIWVGQNVDDYRRTECASHVPAIKSFFKEAHVFMSAEKVEDVTEEKIRAELGKAHGQDSSQWARRSSRSSDKEEKVGTNYRKTNAAMEMRLINRDNFWARAEREEEARKEEDRKRAAEERRRLEKERVMRERKDEEERDRKMNEKLQMIEEQRRKQAEQEEEMRRKEKTKWELLQREHEDDMRARLRRSESIEKAAEAAALVSQRSMNPREFFRQLSSSSSSQSPTSPGSSRSGKPLRRYQRSLTDTAFIFSKAEERAPLSPRSPPLVSPFSRMPPSPIYHTTSPPRSPDFRPVTSPQRPTAPVSPPTSPLRPAAAAAAASLSSLTSEPRAPSPTEPSAPPASPSLLASLSPALVEDIQPHLEVLPASPPNTPTQPEQQTFDFEPGLTPQAPTAPLPDRPQPNTDLDTASHVHTELVSDTGFKVQAALVEEDEEEEEEEEEVDVEEEAKTQPEPCVRVATELVRTEAEEQEEEGEEKQHVEKDEEEEEEEEEEASKQEEVETAPQEELVQDQDEATADRDEDEQSEEDSQVPTEPVGLSEKEEEEEGEEEEESGVTDAEPAFQQVERESVVLSANGIANGEDAQEEQNGIERSLSPSDTELSSPELAVCYEVRGTPEKDEVTKDKEQDISENGQEEVLMEQQMCVRALYDYQAEDESEISFEPGDIIRDVETVDKAWWRGWDKDGRQGLFPANYVETI